MRVVPWDSFLSGAERIESPVSLTIGIFDGLHAGHRRLIEAVRADAGRDADGRTVPLVVTFRQNPDSILPGRDHGGDLQTFRLRARGLAALGIGTVLAIDFSPDLVKLTGKAFSAMLRSHLDVRGVVVGYDFRLGRDRDTDAVALRSLLGGSAVRLGTVDPVSYGGETVSSTRIRAAVHAARFREAEAMLLGRYELDLSGLVPEAWNGGEIAIPLSRCAQALPRAGSHGSVFLGEGCRREGRLKIVGGDLRLEAEGPGPFELVFFS